MPTTIIASNPTFSRIVKGTDFLNVAEFFSDTIQGENFMGYPVTFLRVQFCTQSCVFCDSKAVWRFGNPYTYEELFELMEENNLIKKFKDGQHLILTGGSPVLQQDKLIEFLSIFIDRYGFLPYVEIENECTLLPKEELVNLVSCWNNSPKLRNSENPDHIRYRPGIIKEISGFKNSWFKFVVSSEEDWREVVEDFIKPGLIRRDQVVLMPLGATRLELEQSRPVVVDIACRENLRYSDRLHIVIWDKMTGV